MFIVQVSQKQRSSKAVEFYFEDGLELTILQRYFVQSLLTELFKSIVFYFEDGPEMAICW